ncbi:hypothetical protein SAMN05443247_11491 [Bradyrhizobium erythrophlei]|jgi:hypothetical protein|nr:hypothetical protein SAMN05443247_11491 [Bradyrhizobium erythrophlei]
MDYVKYISSTAWRDNPARLRELEAARFACRLCPNSAAEGYSIEVHHRTYERLGCEVDGDLTALCGPCHQGVTSMLRTRSYAASAPIELVESPNVRSEPLFDPTNPGANE